MLVRPREVAFTLALVLSLLAAKHIPFFDALPLCQKSIVLETVREAPGVVVEDDPKSHTYPQPWSAAGKDPVFVGRIETSN